MTRMHRFTFIAITVAGALLGSSAIALAENGHDHHDHGATTDGAPHSGDATQARDYGALWDAATRAQRAAARDLIERTVEAAARWQDVDVALAEGFVARRDGVGPVHYPNFANRRDDGILDPEHPEALVYLQRPNGDPILLGFVYMVSRSQDRPIPAGDLAAWHVHGAPGCHHPDLDPACGDVRGGMLHVWTYEGVVDPFADPMFASMGSPQAWRSKLFDLAGVARRV